MLTKHTINELEKTAKDLCIKYNLQHAYFTQRFGKRRHFVTGYGKMSLGHTYHLDIDDKLTLFWEGIMTKEDAWIALRPLTLLFNQAEQELDQP